MERDTLNNLLPNMETFIFSKLSKESQESAVKRYEEEQIVQEAANEMIDSDVMISIPALFDSLGWKFNKEGLRISL